MVPRPTTTTPLQPSGFKQPLGTTCAEGPGTEKQRASTATALSSLTTLETPARRGMPLHRLRRSLPAHKSPTGTVPCSQGFLPGANAHRDRRLVPAHWIHRTAAAASAPPAPRSLRCHVPGDQPTPCAHPRLAGASKPGGTCS